MERLGVFLLIIGLGSYILPMMGLQFKLIMIFGQYQNVASIISIVLGLVLIAAKFLMGKKNS